MKRPSYREAIYWLVLNSDTSSLELEDRYFTVEMLLVCDLFGVSEDKLAADIEKARIAVFDGE